MFRARLYPGEVRPNYQYFLSCDSIRNSWSDSDDELLAVLLKKHGRPGVSGPLKEDVEPGWEAIIGGLQEHTGTKHSVDDLKCIIDTTARRIYCTIRDNRIAQNPDLWLFNKV